MPAQPTHGRRLGFTMVELLVAIAVLTILAAVAMSALANLEERAKIERTKTIIKRIDGYLMERWESYHSRPLPLRMPATDVGAVNVATIRLRAIRDLMRMELPERATDIDTRIGPNATNPIAPVNLTQGLTYPSNHPVVALRGTPLPAMQINQLPSVFSRYVRTVSAKPIEWADTYAQSECLYLILSGMRDAESSPLDFLAPSEIGDLDNDGMKEILDGWGQPIWFLRWAPGYTKELGALTDQTALAGRPPDPFDPHGVDPDGFSIRPLLVSGGPDRLIDLYLHYNRQNDKMLDIRYADSGGSSPHYPVQVFYTPSSPQKREGAPDLTDDGGNYADNITNHYVEAP